MYRHALLQLLGSARNPLAYTNKIKALGPIAYYPQPAELMHSRTRLDNDAVIFRARFQDGALTVANLRQFLATTFGVPVAQARTPIIEAGIIAAHPLTLPYRLADVIGVQEHHERPHSQPTRRSHHATHTGSRAGPGRAARTIHPL